MAIDQTAMRISSCITCFRLVAEYIAIARFDMPIARSMYYVVLYSCSSFADIELTVQSVFIYRRSSSFGRKTIDQLPTEFMCTRSDVE